LTVFLGKSGICRVLRVAFGDPGKATFAPPKSHFLPLKKPLLKCHFSCHLLPDLRPVATTASIASTKQSGKRKEENGKWKTENGKWKTESEKRKTENGSEKRKIR
jgi:hypothetical protein